MPGEPNNFESSNNNIHEKQERFEAALTGFFHKMLLEVESSWALVDGVNYIPSIALQRQLTYLRHIYTPGFENMDDPEAFTDYIHEKIQSEVTEQIDNDTFITYVKTLRKISNIIKEAEIENDPFIMSLLRVLYNVEENADISYGNFQSSFEKHKMKVINFAILLALSMTLLYGVNQLNPDNGQTADGFWHEKQMVIERSDKEIPLKLAELSLSRFTVGVSKKGGLYELKIAAPQDISVDEIENLIDRIFNAGTVVANLNYSHSLKKEEVDINGIKEKLDQGVVTINLYLK